MPAQSRLKNLTCKEREEIFYGFFYWARITRNTVRRFWDRCCGFYSKKVIQIGHYNCGYYCSCILWITDTSNCDDKDLGQL